MPQETAVLKKIWIVTKASLLRILLKKKMGSFHALEDLEPLLKIFYTFVCKKVSGKITDKYMENLKQASG